MADKTKINNFQFGSSGFKDQDKTFTFKSREFVPGPPSKGKIRGTTLAYNIRCNKLRNSDACKAAVAIMQKVQHDMAGIPTDKGRILVDELPGGGVSAGYKGGKKRKIIPAKK